VALAIATASSSVSKGQHGEPPDGTLPSRADDGVRRDAVQDVGARKSRLYFAAHPDIRRPSRRGRRSTPAASTMPPILSNWRRLLNRSDLRRRIGRSPDRDAVGGARQPLHEFAVHRALHQQTGAGGRSSARHPEDRCLGAEQGAGQVCVANTMLPDLAAELQHARHDVARPAAAFWAPPPPNRRHDEARVTMTDGAAPVVGPGRPTPTPNRAHSSARSTTDRARAMLSGVSSDGSVSRRCRRRSPAAICQPAVKIGAFTRDLHHRAEGSGRV